MKYNVFCLGKRNFVFHSTSSMLRPTFEMASLAVEKNHVCILIFGTSMKGAAIS